MNISGYSNTPSHDDPSIVDTRQDMPVGNPSDANAVPNESAPENLAPEVGSVPQLNIADFATTLAPYAPTWAHPYASFPEPNLGRLGELPPELFKLFISKVPLADVATLGLVSRSMSAILHSTSSPYASLLPLVEQAWTDDIDMAHLVRMLSEIETLPLPLRPEALRAVASMLPVRPETGTVWKEAITRTQDLVYTEIDPQSQFHMLLDLDVAAWHTLEFSTTPQGKQRQADGWDRMLKMPSECWPPMLDAVVSRKLDFPEHVMKAIVSDETIRFPGVSDSVVAAFANHSALQDDGHLLTDMLQTRLGVTMSQYERIVRPMEAKRLATLWDSTGELFSEVWRRYPTTDLLLVEMTERVALQFTWQNFFITGQVLSRPASAVTFDVGDVAVMSEVARWKDKFSAFCCNKQSAAYGSVVKALRSDEPVPSLIDAITKVVENLVKPQDYADCLADIFSQPLGFQPILLSRWAYACTPGGLGDSLTLLKKVSAWRISVVDEFISRNEPFNAVRAGMAALSAFVNIGGRDKEAIRATFDAVTRMVFETMPSETWGPLLAYIDLLPLHRYETLVYDKEKLNRLHVTFLKNPRAELREPTFTFRMLLCRIAAPIYAELPDRASETASKLENFCDSLGIPLQDRYIVEEAFLDEVDSRIPTGTPHLCSVIREELRKVDLDDDKSFRYILLRKRA
jgi:hypothetical protein